MSVSSFYVKICPDQKYEKLLIVVNIPCGSKEIHCLKSPENSTPQVMEVLHFLRVKNENKQTRKNLPNQNALWGGALIPEHIKFCTGEK